MITKKKKKSEVSSKRTLRFKCARFCVWFGHKLLPKTDASIHRDDVSEALLKWANMLLSSFNSKIYGIRQKHYSNVWIRIESREGSGDFSKQLLLPTQEELRQFVFSRYELFATRIDAIFTKTEMDALQMELTQEASDMTSYFTNVINEFRAYAHRRDYAMSTLGEWRKRYDQFLKWRELPFDHNMAIEGKIEVLFGDIFREWDVFDNERDMELFEAFHDAIPERKQLINELFDEIIPPRKNGKAYCVDSLIVGFKLAQLVSHETVTAQKVHAA